MASEPQSEHTMPEMVLLYKIPDTITAWKWTGQDVGVIGRWSLDCAGGTIYRSQGKMKEGDWIVEQSGLTLYAMSGDYMKKDWEERPCR